jgi:hypothetical protein
VNVRLGAVGLEDGTTFLPVNVRLGAVGPRWDNLPTCECQLGAVGPEDGTTFLPVNV